MTTTKEQMVGKILVVDDEIELKNALVEALSARSYEARGYTNGHEALEALRGEDFDLLISDLMMPEMDGIALIKAALKIDPHLVAIVMTGQGTIQTAVDAMKFGAFDYVLKPFSMQTIMPVLTRAVNMRHLRLENLQLRETIAIYGLSQTIAFTLDPQTVISKLADAALQQTDADEVSILLPTSDGKELYVAAVRGENRKRLLGERVPLDQGISGWVVRERAPLILNGEVKDERFRALWPHPEIRSAISVPMQVANKLVGTINLNAVSRPRPFTLGQMKALTILASTAAAALESASLYKQVQHAEENYRSIFENAVVGIFRATPDTTRFVSVNPVMAQMFGYESPAEMVQSVVDVTPQLGLDPARREEAFTLLRKQGVLENFETRVRRKDGSEIWISANVRALCDAEGEFKYFDGIVQDITERKRAEDALRESEERYRDLVENAHDIIFSHDLEGNYTSVNRAGEQITGYTHEESLSLKITDTIAPEYVNKARDMMAKELAGEEGTAYEVELLAKDGKRIAVEVNTKLILQDGVPVGVQGIARDVTERKLLEAQLRQSQKMEAIGQLAGGVAHDFNNLLTAINGYSGLALQRIDDNHPLKGYLEEIRKAGDRAANLTRQLLAFGRKQILQPLAINLNDVVTEMNKMLRRLIGEDIQFNAKLDPALNKIKADPGQIEQVLVNLIVNARDAMPQGGNLTIETLGVDLNEDYASRHVAVAPGRYVMLAVSDTGTGMSEDTRARIFDPFFTTKGEGKGTGLGLSTVYGIVKQSGGSIWVYSELGHGTTFKVYLPELATSPQKTEVVTVESPMPRGSETILLVEDEDVVRGLARKILEHAGYRVLEASRGEEAVRLCLERAGPIDLLLTDVVMPETSGREVADRLTELLPGLRVLFMSGYTDEAIVHHGVLDSNVEFIQKPFNPAALAMKVREVLDSELVISDSVSLLPVGEGLGKRG
jgi:two-component system cell cycle sensor histidine kinase/response regulator CckA